MDIIAYIIIGLSTLLTLAWCLTIRQKVKNEQVTEKTLELQGFLMTISVVSIFVVPLSPFHLLWMLPASFFLGLLSAMTPLRILWVFSSIYFFFWYIGISNAGRKLYLDGNYYEAIIAFQEEITKKPNSAEAYFNLALAYGKAGQLDNEIEAYKASIKLMPKNHVSHFNLGKAYIEKGEQNKAIELFKRSISLNPDYINAHYAIGKIYAEIGDVDNALKAIDIVRKTDKKSADELALMIKT
jgi:tetratricopeptide (TPR) repeat protein